jgi:hypothetical protein
MVHNVLVHRAAEMVLACDEMCGASDLAQKKEPAGL